MACDAGIARASVAVSTNSNSIGDKHVTLEELIATSKTNNWTSVNVNNPAI